MKRLLPRASRRVHASAILATFKRINQSDQTRSMPHQSNAKATALLAIFVPPRRVKSA